MRALFFVVLIPCLKYIFRRLKFQFLIVVDGNSGFEADFRNWCPNVNARFRISGAIASRVPSSTIFILLYFYALNFKHFHFDFKLNPRVSESVSCKKKKPLSLGERGFFFFGLFRFLFCCTSGWLCLKDACPGFHVQCNV